MDIAARIDEHGKAAWIALMVLAFILFWPIGLALLAYVIWSGRMGCGKHSGPGRWYFNGDREAGPGRWGNRWGFGRPESSGNRAFDEYKLETLKRLEEEQREFKDFLDRLRHAKDKAEFDQFMADRGRRNQGGGQPGEQLQPT